MSKRKKKKRSKKNRRHQPYQHQSIEQSKAPLVSSNTLILAGMILGTLVILVLGVTWVSKTGPQNQVAAQQQTAGELEVLENNVDLGDISMKNGNVFTEYQVVNNSQESVTITKMDTTCMCTKAQLKQGEETLTGWAGMAGHGIGVLYPNQTINPGETITVVADYDPNAHGPSATGPIRRTVNLQTNSKSTPTIALNFSGVVVK